MASRSEPIFNIPPVVTLTVAVLFAVHGVRTLVLSPENDIEFLLRFAFIPIRYEPSTLIGGAVPGGFGAEIWTFVSYALIHGDLTHLIVNTIWLLPFGSAVARRFGAARFLMFFAVTAAAGAAAHLALHAGEFQPMIGASASISGLMAASMRFVFQSGGPLAMWRTDSAEAYRVPALPLSQAARDPRFLAFLGAWFALNALFGLGSVSFVGERAVAWEAHIGGFLAGLLLFRFFDPVPREPAEA